MKFIAITNNEPSPGLFGAIDNAIIVVVYKDGWFYLRSDRIIRNGRKRSTVPRTCRMRAREFRDALGEVIDARNNGKGAKKR